MFFVLFFVRFSVCLDPVCLNLPAIRRRQHCADAAAHLLLSWYPSGTVPCKLVVQLCRGYKLEPGTEKVIYSVPTLKELVRATC